MSIVAPGTSLAASSPFVPGGAIGSASPSAIGDRDVDLAQAGRVQSLDHRRRDQERGLDARIAEVVVLPGDQRRHRRLRRRLIGLHRVRIFQLRIADRVPVGARAEGAQMREVGPRPDLEQRGEAAEREAGDADPVRIDVRPELRIGQDDVQGRLEVPGPLPRRCARPRPSRRRCRSCPDGRHRPRHSRRGPAPSPARSSAAPCRRSRARPGSADGAPRQRRPHPRRCGR